MATNYYNFTAISTNTTTSIVSTSSVVLLHAVILPKASAGTITFNDVTGSPVTYFTLPASTVGTTLYFDDIVLKNGLSVITASADNVIVVWKQG